MQAHPAHLDLVELDGDLIPILEKKYSSLEGVTIHHTDVLQFKPQHTPYSVIANIPYYITSPILMHFLDIVEKKPDDMVIMMQREVGEKILGGTKKKKIQSVLSLMLGYYCETIEPILAVPRTAFSPQPKVDSLVLHFRVKKENGVVFPSSPPPPLRERAPVKSPNCLPRHSRETSREGRHSREGRNL